MSPLESLAVLKDDAWDVFWRAVPRSRWRLNGAGRPGIDAVVEYVFRYAYALGWRDRSKAGDDAAMESSIEAEYEEIERQAQIKRAIAAVRVAIGVLATGAASAYAVLLAPGQRLDLADAALVAAGYSAAWAVQQVRR